MAHGYSECPGLQHLPTGCSALSASRHPVDPLYSGLESCLLANPCSPTVYPSGLQTYCGHLCSSLLSIPKSATQLHPTFTSLSWAQLAGAVGQKFLEASSGRRIGCPLWRGMGGAGGTLLLWVQGCWVGPHSCKGSQRTPFVYSLHRTALSSIRRTSSSKYGFLSISLGLGLW